MDIKYTREYIRWVKGLPDLAGRRRVTKRVERLLDGYPGPHRYLGGGVNELKIDVGPGYRVYYAFLGANRLVLLLGGDKSTQDRDIKKVMELYQQVRED